MKTMFITFMILCFSGLLHADEKTTKILDKAYMNALDKNYQQAIDKALPLLDSLQLSKIEEIILAHQILSLSYCETGKKEKALEHLKALRAFSPKEDFRVFSPSQACATLLSAPKPNSSAHEKIKNR